MQVDRRIASTLKGVTLVVVGLAGVTAVAAAGVAVLFARRIVTPPTKRAEDVEILAIDESTITLSVTIDSMTPGRYSLFFLGNSGHAQVGEILSYTSKSVTRQLIAVNFGQLADARRGRLGGWFYLGPQDLGFTFDDVVVPTELGPAPAWLIPAPRRSGQWVILVHGRAVRREEALRAVPTFRAAGYTSLVISYRNDGDAPNTSDYRYALGDTEWRDVQSAMQWALDHGARELVLMGWSMGGASVLQALTRSPLASSVKGVVLDSPVVDWFSVLDHHAGRLPRFVRLGVLTLLTRRWAGAITGLAAPIDLARLDMRARAAELDRPILLLHSDDDDYVPPTGSRALAAARPDIVTYVPFPTARHTKLWNFDPEKWSTAISSWLKRI